MVDLILVLMVFFMTTVAMKPKEKELGVQLPGSTLVNETVPITIGIDPDGNGIEFVTVSGQGSEIDRERGVPAPVPMNKGAVNPYGAVGGNTIKLEFQMFAAIGGIDLEVAPIPTDSTGSISLGNVGFCVERGF
jgi:hypothetical protein